MLTSASLGSVLVLDGRLSEECTDLRFAALTFVMKLISLWWVKSVVFVLGALIADLAGHRRAPVAATATGAAQLVASRLSGSLKAIIRRPRPPLAHFGITAAIKLPPGFSFPSGHATTAFAGAVSLALLVPRSRRWALPLAAAIAFSRVYLGVHYVGDVIGGSLLGALLGACAAQIGRRAIRTRRADSRPPPG